MIRIMLVDDEPLLLESLEIVLTIKGGFTVCATAENGVQALRLLESTPTDIMLIDLNMPGMGGIELIKEVRERYPDIKMIVLTTFYDEKNISEALLNGASGYLLKDSGKDAIIDAVEQTVKGVGVLDVKVLKKLSSMLGASEKKTSDNMDKLFEQAQLTEREKEITRLIADGYTNSQIASILFISEGTVKNYVSVIYDKFGIKERAKLVSFLKG